MKTEAKDTAFPKKRSLNLGGRLIEMERPWVMGILNLSPDSFYRTVSKDADSLTMEGILSRSVALAAFSDMIDLGAVSTRPGSVGIPEDEELRLIRTYLSFLRRELPDVLFSVDTYRASVARLAADLGAVMINDISAMTMDASMPQTLAELRIPYVLMHMQGTPATMQDDPRYTDIVHEISLFFAEKLSLLNDLGVPDIILDPGFGFGKTVEQNFEMLRRLEEFRIFGLPVMVGVSRKSMIQKSLGLPADSCLNGTTVLNTLAVQKGADILRVHDPEEARQVISLLQLMK